MAMGSVHARGDTFLTFGLKALTETNTSRLATDFHVMINICWIETAWQVAKCAFLQYKMLGQ
jgi:hypothetical protein